MTVKADIPIVISTVIVIAVAKYLLFSACEKRIRVYRKRYGVAVASMALVYTKMPSCKEFASLEPSEMRRTA